MDGTNPDAKRELDWDLHIDLAEQLTHKVIRVTSNETIGTVMVKLMAKLGEGDWSDYVLWWPENKIWLTKPRQTLHGYGIMSDARLELRPVHRLIIVELPDRKRYNVRVNFAVMGLYAVKEICEEFKIRHSEEMSLLRSPLDVDGYEKATGASRLKRKGIFSTLYEDNPGSDSVDAGSRVKVPPKLLSASVKDERDMATSINTSVASATYVGDAPDGGFFSDKFIRSAVERAYLNGLWIDSTLTLYEQGLKERSLLFLRYKYYSFMDLDPRLDEVRINQLYEQAKWSILTENVDCTEEEAYTFAALQFQVQQASSSKLPELKPATIAPGDQISDIDQALNTLQVELGQKDASTDASPAIQLTGVIKFSRPTRLTLRTSKSYFFILKGTTLSYYKTEDSYSHGEQPMQRFNLAGAKAVADVDVSRNKYAMNIIMPSSDETDEFRLTFESAEEYSSWMAGCSMTTKGRPLAKDGYEAELDSVNTFLALKNTSDVSGTSGSAQSQAEIKPEDLVGPHILKKHKSKKIIRQILEAHASMLNLSAMDARLTYIRNWQGLADFGISYYIVRFNKQRKDEILGVSYNRIILMDMNTHEHKKVWRYSAMRSWHVNWESKQMTIDHEDGKLIFTCLSADLRIIHEEIGCNIYLSLRKESGELPDEETFLRLTGGLQNNLSGFAAETFARRRITSTT